MLTTFHGCFQTLLADYGKTDLTDIDVAFDMPIKQWVDSLTRPTINFFLHDIKENTDKRETNPQTLRANGRASTQMPPRRMDLCYMVSVLTTEVQDEHNLLWKVAATLLRYREFPTNVLPPEWQNLETPITARLHDKESGRSFVELWNALGTPPRPALNYIVTAPMDIEAVIETPLVLSRKIDYVKRHTDETVASHSYADAKYRTAQGMVRNNLGQPVRGATLTTPDGKINTQTDVQGRFTLRNVQPGPLVLTIAAPGQPQRSARLTVPSSSYDIALDKGIEGVVRDSSGQPIAGVSVQVVGVNDQAQASAAVITNAQGRFALVGLTSPSTVTLLVKAAEGAEQKIEWSLPAASYDVHLVT